MKNFEKTLEIATSNYTYTFSFEECQSCIAVYCEVEGKDVNKNYGCWVADIDKSLESDIMSGNFDKIIYGLRLVATEYETLVAGGKPYNFVPVAPFRTLNAELLSLDVLDLSALVF